MYFSLQILRARNRRRGYFLFCMRETRRKGSRVKGSRIARHNRYLRGKSQHGWTRWREIVFVRIIPTAFPNGQRLSPSLLVQELLCSQFVVRSHDTIVLTVVLVHTPTLNNPGAAASDCIGILQLVLPETARAAARPCAQRFSTADGSLWQM